MSVALYVPGSRPDRFAKAAATGAVVVLDLEDSVAEGDKDRARRAVVRWLGTHDGQVQVRVNAPGTAAFEADLAALPHDVEVRVPKVDGPEALAGVADRPVHALLESALGIERAFEVAALPQVRSLALGEADLAAELGIEDEAGFDWARSRVVVAAAAAGLPAPMMSVYADLRDSVGLERSCRHGRSLGMWGRAAVHPRQLPTIRAVFARTAADLAWARAVLDALASGGVATLADGSMVDAAMARRARSILTEFT